MMDVSLNLKPMQQPINGNKRSTPTFDNSKSKMNILSLHHDALQAILSHFTYDEVSKLRMVCRYFNEVCQKILNKGFLEVQRYHGRCLKDMKAKLPRRESERRTHPLARHIDVLTGIETRLSLLSMTYYKYTALGVFCFIPGKVLDECYRVLREVVVHKNPPKSYELLQELRDISSMAMEHFEEHIVPTMKRNHVLGNALRTGGSNVTTSSVRPFFRLNVSNDDEDSDVETTSTPCSSSSTSDISHFISAASQQRTPLSTGLARSACVGGPMRLDLVVQQNRMLISSQRREITELKLKVSDYGRKIMEQDRLLNEYGKKLIQLEQKFNASSESRSTTSAVVPTAESLVRHPATNRKRPVKGEEELVGEEESGGKRKKLMKNINNANVASARATATGGFSMSLRQRKN